MAKTSFTKKYLEKLVTDYCVLQAKIAMDNCLREPPYVMEDIEKLIDVLRKKVFFAVQEVLLETNFVKGDQEP